MNISSDKEPKHLESNVYKPVPCPILTTNITQEFIEGTNYLHFKEFKYYLVPVETFIKCFELRYVLQLN